VRGTIFARSSSFRSAVLGSPARRNVDSREFALTKAPLTEAIVRLVTRYDRYGFRPPKHLYSVSNLRGHNYSNTPSMRTDSLTYRRAFWAAARAGSCAHSTSSA
jgi:hypothetical protein